MLRFMHSGLAAADVVSPFDLETRLEMSIVALHLVLVFALICCSLTITGRLAEWSWRDYGNRRFGWVFLGAGAVCSDLHRLKRFHFWLGWIILAAVLFAYGGLMYHYLTGQ